MLLQKLTVYMPAVCLSLEGYVSYTSMRKRFDPSVRTKMCVCVCGDDASPGNHLRQLEHYQMS